jgi:integrase
VWPQEEKHPDAGVIDVVHGWDRVEGQIPPEGRNRRRVPIASALRELLIGELLRTGRRGGALAFGATDHSPFDPRSLQPRADRAWEAAKFQRITLHECRQTFASLMIAAVNATAGAAELLDGYLKRAAE